MGKDIHPPAILLPGDLADHLEPVEADVAVDLDVLVADLGGALEGGVGAGVGGKRLKHPVHLVERPFQVDRRRPGGVQKVIGFLE